MCFSLYNEKYYKTCLDIFQAHPARLWGGHPAAGQGVLSGLPTVVPVAEHEPRGGSPVGSEGGRPHRGTDETSKCVSLTIMTIFSWAVSKKERKKLRKRTMDGWTNRC